MFDTETSILKLVRYGNQQLPEVLRAERQGNEWHIFTPHPTEEGEEVQILSTDLNGHQWEAEGMKLFRPTVSDEDAAEKAKWTM